MIYNLLYYILFRIFQTIQIKTRACMRFFRDITNKVLRDIMFCSASTFFLFFSTRCRRFLSFIFFQCWLIINCCLSSLKYYYIEIPIHDLPQGNCDAWTAQTVRETRVQGILGELAGSSEVLWLSRGQHSAVTRRKYIFET